MTKEATSRPRPVALIILDGVGQNDATENNAVYSANTPVMDDLKSRYPHTLIHTDGGFVGLPEGQMGNSEVGHMNLGAGRVVYQELTRITKAVKDGELERNDVLTDAIDKAVEAGKAVHVMGLLSPGGVHSHEDHVLALLKLAESRGAKSVYLHAFTDGRDTAPKSAGDSIERIDKALTELGTGQIASVVGRFYAMDRDNRWERVEDAYRVVADGKGRHTAKSAMDALNAAYERDETDEFVEATSIQPEGAPITIADGDTVLFANFRSDRARELSRAFLSESFDGFERTPPKVNFVTMTQYAEDIKAPIAFPPSDLKNTLGEVAAARGLKQLRIAETEKYPHVTFFFSGGEENEFEGEERILVPSPRDVKTYDQKPEMSAEGITDKLVEAIRDKRFDLIICNYANGDMVGHTGDFNAAVKAVETVDTCLGRVIEAMHEVGGECLVTADHGNCEMMVDPNSGNPHTSHTTFLVPLIYVGERADTIRDDGSLCDISPTLLTLLGEEAPSEMTGRPLVTPD
ncbi:2,3-bisphosphoglycerate-independent phosphoglycerate mutase [Larsenimonas suaedae]|uniref:2,3-bisphosphoglycerate-independent phosphoglycerate mutase n=1 Tax=Larsenimonas suaedae TaxID=1851019 RepID=A0ABU1GR93_9GAMM|nr:2,3-bisphosphoglycerate-independent phosphoglycerate mutase [Larsenimonas suaedae]MCM2972655.1 2,3-bisphosphoglycerate-independent phosphoglycerate mutase [Larsenimonas suaedae]MDR5894548.1 2,3-bisphosphoglycerate-independent phosphoglycerate mutase [Larsenimonas suaedae]